MLTIARSGFVRHCHGGMLTIARSGFVRQAVMVPQPSGFSWEGSGMVGCLCRATGHAVMLPTSVFLAGESVWFVVLTIAVHRADHRLRYAHHGVRHAHHRATSCSPSWYVMFTIGIRNSHHRATSCSQSWYVLVVRHAHHRSTSCSPSMYLMLSMRYVTLTTALCHAHHRGT